jgi:hypothetical protein
VAGMWKGDADRVETEGEWIDGDSRVLRSVLGISLDLMNRFSNKYF